MKKILTVALCVLLAVAILYYFVLYEGEPVYQGTLVKQTFNYMYRPI